MENVTERPCAPLGGCTPSPTARVDGIIWEWFDARKGASGLEIEVNDAASCLKRLHIRKPTIQIRVAGV